ncbi:hypothetical protein WN51_05103 [Melipona quadrifasciata]|uniref:Uncharacterized protein n=1 Tax=Melipona quadrifasciata TaxID=166423 RepID=A0A0M8ZU44_9HYME|nr:hypothetical protein WN51_05103 [Melipona quadrifasciata]
MAALSMQYQIYSPTPVQNAMGGANLHTPPSIFQHMMGQQNTSQQSGTWMQMPQVPPMSIPWSVPSFQQSELVRFTGGPSFEPVLHQKRKLEACDLLDIRQTKQFITEEKMAAHFKGLHISPNYQQQSVPSTSTVNLQPVTPRQLNMELEMDATNVIDADQIKTGPRLILSEELKRIQQEPILPNSLLSKLDDKALQLFSFREKPSMALVLWEPPIIENILADYSRKINVKMPSSFNLSAKLDEKRK